MGMSATALHDRDVLWVYYNDLILVHLYLINQANRQSDREQLRSSPHLGLDFSKIGNRLR